MSLLSLLHLCDSLFPIGGFSYSDGLESATYVGSGFLSAEALAKAVSRTYPRASVRFSPRNAASIS